MAFRGKKGYFLPKQWVVGRPHRKHAKELLKNILGLKVPRKALVPVMRKKIYDTANGIPLREYWFTVSYNQSYERNTNRKQAAARWIPKALFKQASEIELIEASDAIQELLHDDVVKPSSRTSSRSTDCGSRSVSSSSWKDTRSPSPVSPSSYSYYRSTGTRCEKKKGNDNRERPVCRFFKKGLGCRQGTRCAFRHDAKHFGPGRCGDCGAFHRAGEYCKAKRAAYIEKRKPQYRSGDVMTVKPISKSLTDRIGTEAIGVVARVSEYGEIEMLLIKQEIGPYWKLPRWRNVDGVTPGHEENAIRELTRATGLVPQSDRLSVIGGRTDRYVIYLYVCDGEEEILESVMAEAEDMMFATRQIWNGMDVAIEGDMEIVSTVANEAEQFIWELVREHDQDTVMDTQDSEMVSVKALQVSPQVQGAIRVTVVIMDTNVGIPEILSVSNSLTETEMAGLPRWVLKGKETPAGRVMDASEFDAMLQTELGLNRTEHLKTVGRSSRDTKSGEDLTIVLSVMPGQSSVVRGTLSLQAGNLCIVTVVLAIRKPHAAVKFVTFRRRNGQLILPSDKSYPGEGPWNAMRRIVYSISGRHIGKGFYDVKVKHIKERRCIFDVDEDMCHITYWLEAIECNDVPSGHLTRLPRELSTWEELDTETLYTVSSFTPGSKTYDTESNYLSTMRFKHFDGFNSADQAAMSAACEIDIPTTDENDNVIMKRVEVIPISSYNENANPEWVDRSEVMSERMLWSAGVVVTEGDIALVHVEELRMRFGQSGKVLAIRTRQKPTRWSLPKGRLEPREWSAETAKRELLEETGYDVISGGIKWTYETWHECRDSKKTVTWFRAIDRRSIRRSAPPEAKTMEVALIPVSMLYFGNERKVASLTLEMRQKDRALENLNFDKKLREALMVTPAKWLDPHKEDEWKDGPTVPIRTLVAPRICRLVMTYGHKYRGDPVLEAKLQNLKDEQLLDLRSIIKDPQQAKNPPKADARDDAVYQRVKKQKGFDDAGLKVLGLLDKFKEIAIFCTSGRHRSVAVAKAAVNLYNLKGEMKNGDLSDRERRRDDAGATKSQRIATRSPDRLAFDRRNHIADTDRRLTIVPNRG